MKKDPIMFIKHILESIDDIELYYNKMSKSDFMKDDLRQNAIIRKLEIIGEAVNNLPKDFTDKYPHIPWIDIKDTRNKLIHHYFGVDLDLVFDIIKRDLPKLKKEISEILKGLKSDK